ncbi:MAG: hypothetical protein ABSH56_23350 [Bryobacteraceae bacterium]
MSFATAGTAGIAFVALLEASICFGNSVEATGRNCQAGQVKSCDELRRIAETAKSPRDRLVAVRFISDTSVLSAIANDVSQTMRVRTAAESRLEEARQRESEQKKQAQQREREQKKQAQILEEAQRGIAPNAQEIQAQVALLGSYKMGVTTLDGYYADKWNARDPLLTKLGIVGARYDKSNDTAEFTIAYCNNFDKHVDAVTAVEAANMVQGSFETTRFMADVVAGVSGFSPPTLSDQRVLLTGVDPTYPQYRVKFVGGRLASITKN